MKKLLLLLFCLSSQAYATSQLDNLLDNFHQSAAEANYQGYIGSLAENAVFLGTDSSERWTKTEFADFVKSYFSRGQGWSYEPSHRTITATPDPKLFFFDELLMNENYGRCRGSGVLIKTEAGWKILQYNLSIPVPNAIAKDVVQSIQRYRAK